MDEITQNAQRSKVPFAKFQEHPAASIRRPPVVRGPPWPDVSGTLPRPLARMPQHPHPCATRRHPCATFPQHLAACAAPPAQDPRRPNALSEFLDPSLCEMSGLILFVFLLRPHRISPPSPERCTFSRPSLDLWTEWMDGLRCPHTHLDPTPRR